MKITDKKVVSFSKEVHYKIDIDGKEIWVSTYSSFDEFGAESDVDIFKGREFLTEDQEEDIVELVEEDRNS